ncbi:MAG TPA: PASTA domain-containing protein [Pyrinomonadaceae bacterium]|nr:PASTA domain-containing protein [Pyrinomonadaceae bacterium]
MGARLRNLAPAVGIQPEVTSKSVSVAARIIAVFRRLGIAISIAIAFLFGLATTVYLSLRSPEVTVPNVVGIDRFAAERILEDAGLNFRVRASRPSRELKADTVLFQLPRSGQVVKAGQTVAMDISRAAKEGESTDGAIPDQPTEEKPVENRNIQASANTNESKPRRQKLVNKNANENDNVNRVATNANSNTSTPNVNAGRNLNSANNADSARVAANANLIGNTNRNVNRLSPAAKPSPGKQSNRPD